jgi:hypothetical protein
MSGRRASSVSDTVKPISHLAGKATISVSLRKILLLGAIAPLLVIAAVPILLGTEMPAGETDSKLNCYDRVGNYEPCVTRATVSPSHVNGRTTAAHQPASWTTTALYQQAVFPGTVVDHPADWTTSTVDQPASSTISVPATRRSSTLGKRQTICGRRLIPCLFSALRSGFTHIASVAATVGQARPAREHL